MNQKQRRSGLLPLEPDSRDLHLGKIVKLPAIEELPDTFSLGDTIIRNQEQDGNYDFCTAYGTIGMAYLQDGIEGSQEWTFAAFNEISGNHEGFGQNMRDPFKAWVKYGSPRRGDVIVPKNLNERRYLKNYDSNLSGDQLKKKTYVTCKGPYDAFDNIRASIWKFREERRAVGVGVIFAWQLNEVYLKRTREEGFGHFMFCTGWSGGYLETVNSYGMEAGKNGKHWLSRQTINHFVGKFGAYMLIDMPVEEARAIQKSKEKSNFRKFLEYINVCK